MWSLHAPSLSVFVYTGSFNSPKTCTSLIGGVKLFHRYSIQLDFPEHFVWGLEKDLQSTPPRNSKGAGSARKTPKAQVRLEMSVNKIIVLAY